MTDVSSPIPHFTPYSIAHDLNSNFPLSKFGVDWVDSDIYILNITIPKGHPVYSPTTLAMRLDMNLVELGYDNYKEFSDTTIRDIIRVMIPKMHRTLGINTLSKYAPWVNSSNHLPDHPRLPTIFLE